MKIIVTGSLGNISKPLTEELVQRGHNVTVISSKADKQKDIETLGAKAAIGSLEDVHFLADTFKGADVVYSMVPPVNYFDHSIDLMGHYLLLINNYAKAIQQSGVKRLVHLSSIGAHLEQNSGLILCHRAGEDILNTLSDVAITFMRPTAFYYNLFGFVAGIKNAGIIASNYGAEDTISWVSPVDIAAAVAQEIVTPFVGKKVIYVASEELTCNEVASILGEAIGKPDLKWVVIPDEQLQTTLNSIGMAPRIAAAFVEMQAGMHSRELFEDYYKNQPVMGKIKMKDFAKEFAVGYNKNM